MHKCFYCRGTGIYERPLDENKYESIYDRYDNMGQFMGETCRQKALAEARYIAEKCPYCNDILNKKS